MSPDDVKQRLRRAGRRSASSARTKQRRASHILITVKPDATRGREEGRARQGAGRSPRRCARTRPSFAGVAKKESQDPGSAAQGGDLGFFARGAMVKPFEEAAFAAKKGDIVGPVKSDFGYHVIRVTDVKPAQVKSLAEATPEIEADPQEAGGLAANCAEAAENFSNIVYEQLAEPEARGRRAEARRPARRAGSARASRPPRRPRQSQAAGRDLLRRLDQGEAQHLRRSRSRPTCSSPRTWSSTSPRELRPLDAVKADIEQRLQREQALKLATADGEAKLKELQAGKDAGLKWPAPLAVNRQKPGGLCPDGDRQGLPRRREEAARLRGRGYAGGLLAGAGDQGDRRWTRSIDAKREALAGRLRDAVAARGARLDARQPARAASASTVRKGALEKSAAS